VLHGEGGDLAEAVGQIGVTARDLRREILEAAWGYRPDRHPIAPDRPDGHFRFTALLE
jgi:hypothetical protein